MTMLLMNGASGSRFEWLGLQPPNTSELRVCALLWWNLNKPKGSGKCNTNIGRFVKGLGFRPMFAKSDPTDPFAVGYVAGTGIQRNFERSSSRFSRPFVGPATDPRKYLRLTRERLATEDILGFEEC